MEKVYNQIEHDNYKGKKILSEQWEVEFIEDNGLFWHPRTVYYYTENKHCHEQVFKKWKKEFSDKDNIQFKRLIYI